MGVCDLWPVAEPSQNRRKLDVFPFQCLPFSMSSSLNVLPCQVFPIQTSISPPLKKIILFQCPLSMFSALNIFSLNILSSQCLPSLAPPSQTSLFLSLNIFLSIFSLFNIFPSRCPQLSMYSSLNILFSQCLSSQYIFPSQTSISFFLNFSTLNVLRPPLSIPPLSISFPQSSPPSISFFLNLFPSQCFPPQYHFF